MIKNEMLKIIQKKQFFESLQKDLDNYIDKKDKEAEKQYNMMLIAERIYGKPGVHITHEQIKSL